MTIEPVGDATLAAFHDMRAQLYPTTRPETVAQLRDLLAEDDLLFLVALADARVAGFAEAAIRRDYVNGCDTSPVLFLEGIYVDPGYRGSGIAKALVESVAQWGRERGCTEFASDTPVENTQSQAMHRALGFEETERVVYFRKLLNEL